MPRTRQPRTPRTQTKKVKLELFSIHGHLNDQPIDYGELMRFLSGLDLAACTEVTGDRFVRARVSPEQDGLFRFSAYTGSADKTFLVLDVQAGTEEERGLEEGKLVVRKTLGLINPARREAVVQLVHHGVQAFQLAQLLERFARRADPERYEGLSLEFAPIAGNTFLHELELFQRIQSATIRLVRPNYDWEEYGTTLQTLGQDSHARNLEISASANRNGSLAKNDGIVGLLKDLVQRTRGIVKNASVSGLIGGQAGPITLDLNRFVESRTAQLDVSATGQPVEAEVHEVARQFLTERVDTME